MNFMGTEMLGSSVEVADAVQHSGGAPGGAGVAGLLIYSRWSLGT